MSDQLCDYMNMIELSDVDDLVEIYRFEWSIVWDYMNMIELSDVVT